MLARQQADHPVERDARRRTEVLVEAERDPGVVGARHRPFDRQVVEHVEPHLPVPGTRSPFPTPRRRPAPRACRRSRRAHRRPGSAGTAPSRRQAPCSRCSRPSAAAGSVERTPGSGGGMPDDAEERPQGHHEVVGSAPRRRPAASSGRDRPASTVMPRDPGRPSRRALPASGRPARRAPRSVPRAGGHRRARGREARTSRPRRAPTRRSERRSAPSRRGRR